MSAEAKLAKAQKLLKEAEELTASGADVRIAVHSKATEATEAASQALVTFRQEKNLEGRTNSLEALIKACMTAGDLFDAQRYAQDELQMLKGEDTGDKAALAFATEQVVKVLTLGGDVELALEHSQELLELQRGLGSQEGEARALRTKAELKLHSGHFGQAIEAGEAAVSLCRELKDAKGVELAQRVISTAYCLKGTPEAAPGRQLALLALEELKKALKSMSKADWMKAYEDLDNSASCVDSDWDFIPQMLASTEDRKSLLKFLEQCGVDTQEYGGQPRAVVTAMDTDSEYQKWRIKGMGYGPRFRFVRQANVIDYKSQQYCASVLQVTEVGDDWDRECLLASNLVQGMVQCASIDLP